MKDFKIVDMNLETDKPQINSWQTLYAGTDEFKAIEHFILEDHLLYDLGEVVETNFEVVNIGDNEIKKALVAKTNEDEIVGFICAQSKISASRLWKSYFYRIFQQSTKIFGACKTPQKTTLCVLFYRQNKL